MTTFKYIHQNESKPMLLVPGWATDCRIFSQLPLPYNLLLTENINPTAFTNDLYTYLSHKGIESVSMIGFSMGGFLGADFISLYPNMVDTFTAIGIRHQYPKETTLPIKAYLKKNKSTFLTKFFENSFQDSKDFNTFKHRLLPHYLENMSLSYLLDTLDYLETHSFSIKGLSSIEKMTIIHGDADQIAPLNEAQAIHKSVPSSQLITLKNIGHFPFFTSDFRNLRFT
ncbi:MAG: alpha/beta hydrolase [Candidatus Margulisbacteria bacterium]|nr:alpha/beta hydrolase [Candidatus Margulisiibacteriota bacterium]